MGSQIDVCMLTVTDRDLAIHYSRSTIHTTCIVQTITENQHAAQPPPEAATSTVGAAAVAAFYKGMFFV